MAVFRDRTDAGRALAEKLAGLDEAAGAIVLALPRGGVPVAYEIALELGISLDVFAVRKLGVPGHEELAFGAIATGGVRVLNEDVVRSLGISEEVIETVATREERELERRQRSYRGNRPAPDVAGRTAVMVDDGLATGSTMRAAITAVKKLHPRRVVVAVPVGAASTCRQLRQEADRVVCVATPEPMTAISVWYQDFAQTSDDEVRELLERTRRTSSEEQP
ncbi:MAG: phosphoribosyltransferase [Actinomycetota bacterium]